MVSSNTPDPTTRLRRLTDDAVSKKLIIVAAAMLLSGCAVYTVVDTAVSVGATAVETTADVAAGAVDIIVPDGDDDDD